MKIANHLMAIVGCSGCYHEHQRVITLTAEIAALRAEVDVHARLNDDLREALADAKAEPTKQLCELLDILNELPERGGFGPEFNLARDYGSVQEIHRRMRDDLCLCCGGEGEIASVCEECDGDGTVEVDTTTRSDFEPSSKWCDCEDCGGNGYRKIPCPGCRDE